MSSLADINTHVREVLNIVNNPLAARAANDSVAQSWIRCLNEFRLDPARFVMPPVLTQQELADRREAAGDLIACSKLEMTTLYQQLADPELAVVLVDADGVIVHQVSSVPFGEAVAADGLRVGALWSEREAGTNGMGTCLIERDCIAVCQHEHFYPRYTSLTCSAAPIFDDRGDDRRRARRDEPLEAPAAAFARARRHVAADDREPLDRCALSSREHDPLS